MRATRRNRVLVGAAVAIPAALSVAPPAPAAEAAPAPPPSEPPPLSFCATMLLSPEQLAAGVRSTISCFSTNEESLRSIHVDPGRVGSARTASTDGGAELDGASGLVAVHYESANGRGMFLNVGGDSCEGGGMNLTGYWNDRVRSTAPRGCSTIKHWADADYGGASESITGSLPGNLLNLGGQVSSVRYYGPATGL